MQFKLGSLNKTWVDSELKQDANEEQKNKHSEDMRRIIQFVSDILLSENLLVLTGLGTSLSVTKPNKGKNQSVAPKMSDLWNAVKQNDEKQFDKIIQKIRFDTKISGENIESLLSKCQLVERLEPDQEIGTFLKNAEATIVDKCDFVDEDVNVEWHEMFLRKVGRRSTRLPRTQIFTTNYDLCFEKAAARTKFFVIDGFSPTISREFDGTYFNFDIVSRNFSNEHTPSEYIPNVFHLHKLHGSIDWENNGNSIRKVIRAKNPCIIFPQDGKYESSYSTPYLEMMSRFQSSLRKTNLGLLIIGFGFNDNHISHPILQALKSNVHLKALIVDPFVKDSENQHLMQIANLVNSGDWRIGLINGTFEKFSSLLPDFVKESESDRHFERTKGMR